MEPNNWAEFNDANANGVGNSASASGEHAAASTSCNAESVFVSKNSSLKALAVLSAGLKNADGADLIDLEGDPWKSLPVRTIRPQREDYAEEISRRYESENLLVTANMSRAPKPKQWDKNIMLTWLDDHPISHPTDVQFIQDTVQDRKESAEWVNAVQQLENDSVDKAEKAWYGPLPMLRLIMALDHSEDIRHAYLKRNDISKERIALDNQKSVDKRVTTVWELLASLWNDPEFSPVTEHVEDLHSDFTYLFSIPHGRVATLTPATPDKVKEKISTMIVTLQRIICRWTLSGQGDGGVDVNDGDVDHVDNNEFGSLANRPRGSLHRRAGFLGNSQPYLLYFWEMLDKYQLLSTAFSELNQKMSAKNDGEGVPSVINNSWNFDSNDDDEGEFSDTGSSLASSAKKQSSRKSDTSTRSAKKMKHSNFSQGLQRLAESNIIAARMDYGSAICTNILLLEAELPGYDMALTDGPNPRKKKVGGTNGNCSSRSEQIES
jgi:hypothetical protein